MKMNTPSLKDVEDGVLAALAKHPHLDSITFAGNSEPTAHPQFAEMVGLLLDIRSRTQGQWILNALSNGSELQNPAVVEACDRLDEIWVKLDCADDDLFQRLNRPIASVGRVEDHIKRIGLLKAPRIQSLFWLAPSRPEMSNWTEGNRKAFVRAIETIQPKQVFVTTVSRLPAAPMLQPVALPELEELVVALAASGLDVQVFV